MRLAAAAALLASVAMACGSTTSGPRTSLPSRLPVPLNAVLDIGRDGPGLDGGHPFYTFSSQLAPDVAFAAYSNELVAAGFDERGANGSWHVFSNGDFDVSVRVGTEGPPTVIYVRIDSETAGGGNGGADGNAGHTNDANGKGPDASHGNQGNGSGNGPDPSTAPNPNSSKDPSAGNGSNSPNPNSSKDPSAGKDAGPSPTDRPDHPTQPPKPAPPHGS